MYSRRDGDGARRSMQRRNRKNYVGSPCLKRKRGLDKGMKIPTEDNIFEEPFHEQFGIPPLEYDTTVEATELARNQASALPHHTNTDLFLRTQAQSNEIDVSGIIESRFKYYMNATASATDRLFYPPGHNSSFDTNYMSMPGTSRDTSFNNSPSPSNEHRYNSPSPSKEIGYLSSPSPSNESHYSPQSPLSPNDQWSTPHARPLRQSRTSRQSNLQRMRRYSSSLMDLSTEGLSGTPRRRLREESMEDISKVERLSKRSKEL